MAKVEYRKEFFDRDYTVREAYARVWRYARRYRARLALGVVCGMLTAGTLVPFFQIVQPALQHVESHDERVELAANGGEKGAVVEPTAGGVAADSKDAARHASGKGNAIEREIARRSKLPGWYPKVERLAAKLGFRLENERGGMGGALVLMVCVIVPIVAFARLALMFLNRYCLSWAGAHAVADLRQDMLEHVQRQNMQFFGRVDMGQLLSRIFGDPHQIQIILSTIVSELALAPFEIVVAIGFIVWFAVSHHMLATMSLIAIGFPLFVLPVQMLGRAIRRWARKSLERGSMIGAKIHEILTCIRVVKSYHTEEFENAQFAKTNRYLLKSTMRALRMGLMVGPTVETVGIILICAFMVWCFIVDVKVSDVVPMLAPLLVIYKPVKQMSKLQVQIENSLAALSRVYSVLDLHMELPENPSAAPKTDFVDRISFRDVSFRYDTSERDAVSHATFDVPRGRMVAVVGGTGSGKSTLSGLLARFFDPREGTVSLDGIDLRDMRIRDLRRLVGAVMQETLLFNDTIEANIRYGSPDATHEQVVAAARMANAHDFIMAHPEGYSRIVGEKGFALSGGERQRIAIARAILRNPPILILDEATSALDTVTERLVQDALDRLMENRTTFAIAHRLSTIRHADLILVMQDGAIVERGTHDELFAAGGVYRKLCDMQHQT